MAASKEQILEAISNMTIMEVVDLVKQPHLARRDDIVVVPTLVRQLPQPIRKIIGDLSNVERVLIGLEVRPRDDEK